MRQAINQRSIIPSSKKDQVVTHTMETTTVTLTVIATVTVITTVETMTVDLIHTEGHLKLLAILRKVQKGTKLKLFSMR